ncbi:MAG: RsbRD N-terminal domain-containing protein [Peptococcaceae bacterium]
MSNRLNQLMQKKHEELQMQWFEQAIAAYPAEAHKYFVKVKNEFTNPVGSNIYRSLGHLLEELSGERDADQLYQHLEMILKIRAVQDLKPSKALAFLPSLKNLIQTVFQDEIKSGEISQKELEDLFTDIDTLMLIAFDLYSESKEMLYNLRIAQIKETNDILQRANLLNESVDTSTFMRCSNYIEEE